MKSKHTKGECKINNVAHAEMWVNVTGEKGIFARTFWGSMEPIINEKEATANAQLICDAFNVTNETGMTPIELKKSHAELLDVCRMILKEKTNELGETPQLTSWQRESIEKAINNATKQQP